MSKQRIVLTGATGLIGRSVVDRLHSEYDLVSVGRRPPPQGVKWVSADLDSPLELGGMPASADSMIYLAQSEHFRDFPERAREIFSVNIANVQRILDWGRRAGVQRVILASSGGIYGHGEGAFREDDVIRPTGPLGYYLASKQCAELLTESYASFFTVIILRFFFVYGPSQRRSMLIPRLIDSVRQGRAIKLQGEEGIRLNPIFVDDAAQAVARSLLLGESQKINVAGAEALPLRRLAELIGHTVGRDPLFEIESDQPPRHLVGDIAKMVRLLGRPGTSVAEGLRRTAAGPVGEAERL